MNIAILQPEVPHYRRDFFNLLRSNCNNLDIYVYNSPEKIKKQGFNEIKERITYIPNINIKGIVIYNPFVLLSAKYDVIVLMLHQAHFTSWLLLMTKFIHRKKVIVWGQGISIKRYIKEEKQPNILLKMMLAMSDGAWIYMPKEFALWKKIFPQKKMVALYNTISNVKEMTNYNPLMSKEQLKEKYNIKEEFVFVYCSRFNTTLRRTDILLEVIKKIDKNKYGFIIIGDGEFKPDFNSFENVYDFGALYDIKLKQELFYLSDAYFQPAWLGLSIVEAMAYGKPVFTFKRTNDFKQGVEYDYIKHNKTGLLFNDFEDCIQTIDKLDKQQIIKMGNNAKNEIKEFALPEKMADNALNLLKQLYK